MSVTEKLMAPGVFNVSLDIDLVPNSIVNSIEPWEHVVIMPARVSEDELDDASMLASAEYVGIINELTIEEETVEIEGSGLVSYLGDNETRGLPVAEKGGLSAKRTFEDKTLSFVLDMETSISLRELTISRIAFKSFLIFSDLFLSSLNLER